ncbi:MAG: transglycosylase SLT domain-containing protein [Deltaproteobacteria bacterium]|nr:transglycosylase SLT domain-containing protein [Deltaproteobacteria bacterium]
MPESRRTLHYFTSALAAGFIVLNLSSCSFYYKASASGNTETLQPAINIPEPVSEKPQEPEIIEECAPEDCLAAAIRLKKDGSIEETRLKLIEIRKRFPDTVWAARASFLLGISAVEDKADSGELFVEASSIPGIEDYTLFYQARSFASQKKFSEAAAFYDAVLALYPDSALKSDALYLKAAAYFEDGNFLEARACFSEFISTYPKSSLVPEALVKSSRSSIELNEIQEALKTARVVTVRYPTRSAAKEAEALIENIRLKGEPLAELTVEERFNRAGRLFDATHYSEAIAEFSSIAKKQKNLFYDKAVMKVALSRIRLKEYDKAEKVLKDYLKAKKPKNECEALNKLALVALRQGKEDLLLEVEDKLAAKFPRSREHAEVLNYIGRFYEGKNLHEPALEAFEHVAQEFKGSDLADTALWSIGWINYRAGRFEQSLKHFSSYREIHPQGAELVRHLYWSARSAEKLGMEAQAINYYESLCAPFKKTYYCQMAEERLAKLMIKEEIQKIETKIDETVEPAVKLASMEAIAMPEPYVDAAIEVNGTAKAQEIEMPVPEAGAFAEPLSPLFGDRHYIAAKELIMLGLQPSASAEVDILTKKYSKDRQALYELADLFYQADDYQRALRIYRLYLADADDNGQSTVFAFPLKLIDVVKNKAPEGAANPYLVAAVMREESAFNPKAVSPTGALGLMQIMPSTGKQIAKELGRQSFDSKHLLDPEVNIEFGSWYLGSLARRFDNNIVFTIAGYNAGPNAVARWAETLPSELDEFIESIPYPETRNYAKKVLKSYTEYLRLSGENPSERFSRPVITRTEKEGPALIKAKPQEQS